MARYSNFKIWFYDDSLSALGSTTNVVSARYKCGIDTIGEGEFTIPLVDTPARQYIAKYNVAVFTCEVDGTLACFGEIVIDRADEIIVPGGIDLYRVRGLGRLSKLRKDRFNYQIISNGSGGATNTATTDILALSQYATWTTSTTDFTSPFVDPSAYLVTANDTLLEGVIQALNQNNHHIVDEPGGSAALGTVEVPLNQVHLKYDMTALSSTVPGGFGGWHLKRNADPTVKEEAPILSIDVIEEEKEIVTKGIIRGGGLGSGIFTMADASGTKTAPSGYTYDFTNSTITNDTLEAVANQPRIVKIANLSNIKPQDPADATSSQTAAEQLVDAGQLWMEERVGGFDTYYRVSSVAPWDTFVGGDSFFAWPAYITGTRLEWDKDSPYNAAGSEVTTTIIDVDEVMHMLEVEYSVTNTGRNAGVLMAEFLLGPAPRQERSAEALIADEIAELKRRLEHASAQQGGSTVPDGTVYVTTDAPLLTAAASTALANERAGTDGLGTIFTDNGAGTTFQFDIRTPLSVTTSSTNDPGTTSTGHTHDLDTSGLVLDSEAFVTIGNTAGLSAERALTAGDGIAITDAGANSTVTIDVDLATNSGLTFSTAELTLGTPGTITSSSTNAVTTTTHTHAIDGTIATANLAYVTIGNTASLSAERALIAGNGIVITDGGANSTVTTAVDLATNSGLTFSTGDLTLGTPSSITSTSTNSVTTTTHTHAAGSTLARANLAYVTIGNTGSLTAERALTSGNSITVTDGGANSTVTVNLNTPGTLTVSTSNSSSTNHTHAITSSSSVSTATATLLASNSSGRLRLQGLAIGQASSNNALEITKTSGSPAVIVTADVNGEFATPDGQNMIFGHWNSGTSTFTERWRMGTSTDILYRDAAVAHGITDLVDTSVYGSIDIFSATAGGIGLFGYSESDRAVIIRGAATSDNTTKSASGVAPVELRANKKSTTNIGAMGTNANLVIIRDNTSTRWIVDAEGDTHRDGTSNTFDDYHDAQLARAFDLAVSPGTVIDSDFDSWVQYGRDDLIAAGILHDSGFYNESRLLRLAIGAVWQGYEREKLLEARVEQLERRLLDAA